MTCSIRGVRSTKPGSFSWLKSTGDALVRGYWLRFRFDIGAGKLMVHELEQSGIPVQLVPMDELSQVLNQTPSGTVVTHRYFIKDAESNRGSQICPRHPR